MQRVKAEVGAQPPAIAAGLASVRDTGDGAKGNGLFADAPIPAGTVSGVGGQIGPREQHHPPPRPQPSDNTQLAALRHIAASPPPFPLPLPLPPPPFHPPSTRSVHRHIRW